MGGSQKALLFGRYDDLVNSPAYLNQLKEVLSVSLWIILGIKMIYEVSLYGKFWIFIGFTHVLYESWFSNFLLF